jgi:uncharacterized protein YqgV (UPF0045/DUF77 family)
MVTAGLGESAESQDALLQQLHLRVKDTYRKCVGDAETSLNTLQMLTAVEGKLEHLLETLESMPQSIVEHAEKVFTQLVLFCSVV